MVQDTTPEKISPFSIFRNRNFSLLWFGQLISEFGTGITSIAASILVYRETGSALSVGLMLMATAIPGLLFGLFAGVFVDRYDRKKIMIAAEFIRAFLIFLIPVLLPYGIWWLYILVMISSTIAQFFNPAHSSVIPDIASDEELAAANSMMAISSTGALGLGFATAGFITASLPVEWAFYLDAFTFVLSGIAILFVKIPKLEVNDKTSVKIVVNNLQEGGKFLWNSAILRSTLLISIPMAILFGLHNSLLLPFANKALNATEFEYGLIEGISMVGFVAGSFWMASVGNRLREGQWISLSFIGMGVVTMVYSQISTVGLAIGLGVVMAFTNVPSYIGRQLVVQRNTTREVRGRVTSVFYVVRDVMFMIGMGAAGLADTFDIRSLFLLEAILLTGVGVIALFMPGLGQPAAQWRRAISLLRGVNQAAGLEGFRSATLADIDRLAGYVPAMSRLSEQERKSLLREMEYVEAPSGTAVVRDGEVSDSAYFILNGRAVAGKEDEGKERVLEVLNQGDFFGEIAALTGMKRTANVVVDEPVEMLRVSADGLRKMSSFPELNRIFMSKMMERMARMNMIESPKAIEYDQEVLRDLRTAEPASA